MKSSRVPLKDALLVAAAALVVLPLAFAGCSPDDGEEDAGPPRGSVIARDGGLFAPRDAGPPPDGGLDAGEASALCPPDDGLEDNDERASAYVLESGQEVDATFCGGDDDWFSVAAQSGCQVEARVRFDPRGGDLDLSLYEPSGTLVGSSTTTGDTELISVSAGAAGAYAARVRGVASAKTRYRVRMTATCLQDLSCPADDGFEENDDETQMAALSEGAPAVGIACPDDDDWFSFSAPAGCVAVASLKFTHSADGNLNLRTLRPDGSEGDRSLSVTDDERVVEGGSAEGPLAFRVYGLAGDTNTYRLSAERVCKGDLACPSDDPFEPNDERTASHRLYPPTEIPGVACGTDEDWYRVFVSSGCTLEVAAEFSDAEGDLDLQLLDSSDAVLAQSRSSTDNEGLSYTPASSMSAYLRAWVFQGAGAPGYRMSVSETCPDAGP